MGKNHKKKYRTSKTRWLSSRRNSRNTVNLETQRRRNMTKMGMPMVIRLLHCGDLRLKVAPPPPPPPPGTTMALQDTESLLSTRRIVGRRLQSFPNVRRPAPPPPPPLTATAVACRRPAISEPTDPLLPEHLKEGAAPVDTSSAKHLAFDL